MSTYASGSTTYSLELDGVDIVHIRGVDDNSILDLLVGDIYKPKGSRDNVDGDLLDAGAEVGDAIRRLKGAFSNRNLVRK